MSSVLAKFYNLEEPDDYGRRLDEMWLWDHDRLEVVHNYIQWMFPLNERSQFNLDAPLLKQKDIAEIKQTHVWISFVIICNFYGIVYDMNSGIVERDSIAVWQKKAANWLTPRNHNLLRLTRIIKSLRLFGLVREADALKTFLISLQEHYPNVITDVTVKFWQEA